MIMIEEIEEIAVVMDADVMIMDAEMTTDGDVMIMIEEIEEVMDADVMKGQPDADLLLIPHEELHHHQDQEDHQQMMQEEKDLLIGVFRLLVREQEKLHLLTVQSELVWTNLLDHYWE